VFSCLNSSVPQVCSKPSFLDYIRAGTEISFVVAVDFTASNRPPSDPFSLHYLHPSGAPTPYEQALLGVGRVLEYYDSDRQYPAYGFGGQYSNNPVSHCFPLNGQPDAVCAGIQGIQQAYRAALGAWQLSGPTLFAPVIKAASAYAAQPTPHLRYTVLLILTDGIILDMQVGVGLRDAWRSCLFVPPTARCVSIVVCSLVLVFFWEMHWPCFWVALRISQ
jgi:hypothetical protein